MKAIPVLLPSQTHARAPYSGIACGTADIVPRISEVACTAAGATADIPNVGEWGTESFAAAACCGHVRTRLTPVLTHSGSAQVSVH
jgi:hypothetical protein